MTYQVNLVLAPVTEPVSLADVKAYLRVDSSAEDALLTFLITSARSWMERATGRAMNTQTWRMTLDAWPAETAIKLPRTPVASVNHVKVYAADGSSQTLDPGSYLTDINMDAPRIVFKSLLRPRPGLPASGIEIEFVAGYGDLSTDVPEPLAQAVKLLVAHWYERRELLDAQGLPNVPRALSAVVGLYRSMHL